METLQSFRRIYKVTNRHILNNEGEDQADYIESEIRDERHAQDKKWGAQNHEPFKWLAILGEEIGEVNKAALEAFNFKSEKWDHEKLKHYRLELVQSAAVTKAMIECIDRDTWSCALSMGYKTSSQKFAEDRTQYTDKQKLGTSHQPYDVTATERRFHGVELGGKDETKAVVYNGFSLVELLPYQIRVIEEKQELDTKVDKLFNFLRDDKTSNRQSETYALLVEQLEAMRTYQNILHKRISLWGVSGHVN